MIVSPTDIDGLYVLEAARRLDERGWFARTYDVDELAEQGLAPVGHSAAVSYNARAGTLRGMHYQREPHGERKIVRCSAGSIYDVVVDVRPSSETYLQWRGFELDADRSVSLYLGEGLAHGFMSLRDGSEVSYQLSAPHAPAASAGVRWDDPAVGIRWPLEPVVMNARDRDYPLLDQATIREPRALEDGT